MAQLADERKKAKELATLKKPSKNVRRETIAQVTKAVRDLEDTVRLIFPCPKSMKALIDGEWHKRKLGSRSETIRVLLAEALR